MAAQDARVAVAWFTHPEGQPPAVKVSWSIDHGTTFGAPVLVDDSGPLGRPAVAFAGDGSLVVSWIGKVAEQYVLRVRRILPDRSQQEPITIAPVQGQRSDGFPNMASCKEGILLTWTDRQQATCVAVALLQVTQEQEDEGSPR